MGQDTNFLADISTEIPINYKLPKNTCKFREQWVGIIFQTNYSPNEKHVFNSSIWEPSDVLSTDRTKTELTLHDSLLLRVYC